MPRQSKEVRKHVIQCFDTKTKQCVGQQFIAGDQVDWEMPNGDHIDPQIDCEYQPFDMVQPEVEATEEQLQDWVEGEAGA